MKIRLADLDLTLLPDRAAWLPGHRTLVVADLHLGKSATFRARGIPVPEGETHADLGRLGALARRTGAERIVIAGDLVHAADGLVPEIVALLRAFLESSRASVMLVEGNHDRTARLHRLGLPLEIRHSIEIDDVTLVHDPAGLAPSVPAICGHLHPSLRLPLSPRRSTRVPCFHLRSSRLILPAFGSFTGTHPIHPAPGDRVFTGVRDEVREIPPPGA